MSPIAHSRAALSFAASLLLHVSLALLLWQRGASTLVLQPSPLLLHLVDAGMRTEGPGVMVPELRQGGGAPAGNSGALPREAPVPAVRADSPAPTAKEPPRETPVARMQDAADPPPKSPASQDPEPPRPPQLQAKPPRTTTKTDAAPKRDVVRTPPPRPTRVERDTPRTGRGTGTAADAANEGEGTGNAASGTASAAAGTSSAAVGTASAAAWADAARVRYEALLFAWMERHKQYPLLAQRRGLEGSGVLRVRIDRSGRVLERQIVRSTGTPALDDAALDMVRRASPFPAVPAEYAGTTFEFVAPVEYRLR
jgi:protein TonB